MRLLTVKINNHTVTHGATALCVCARFDVTSWIIQHALGAGDGYSMCLPVCDSSSQEGGCDFIMMPF